MTADFVFHEVRRERDVEQHSAVVGALERWCYLPYPACSRRNLEQVDLFLVASPTSTSASTAAASTSSTTTTTTTSGAVEDASSAMVGVVGVVWVPLAPGREVEGYIQVVLVQSAYRRRHIAEDLLQRVLQLVGGGDSVQRIFRWRLHTMVSSPQTTAYLRRVLPENDNPAVQNELLEEMERLVAAVPRVYEKLGFTIRKNMYAYYNKSADAVEMVRRG
ncbi:transferase [Trypanosoma rangeli]|uniref:Transferase n=1 Tax=Trypanosoma rangeli TaxID=5698 RepID=A0A3S5ISQ7_TRYRA|nr:transferase [Trypanosoma rangeli]RNF12788.1 transferase [Trypanosoma rangeli]|eukprot:RNF12788.1 transferase [Trypanosoma rangeli]